MRIVIGYPPLDDPRGHHQTGQNRQAQVFHHVANIYPVVPALAATLLKRAGHEVLWLDGGAEEMSWFQYEREVYEFKPEIVAWEAKTPSIKRTWGCARKLKDLMPEIKIALFGDHVTARPAESLVLPQIDHVISGGDYDFSLLELVRWYENKYPTPGFVELGTSNDLTKLPIVDRELTKWWLYGYEKGSGNYKYLPGTHTYFGRDCWWRQGGGCTFCSWTNTYKNFRVCDVDQAMAELERCASLGIREVFDDTGTFPAGAWLHKFCDELRKFNKGKRHGKACITMGCNMRPGALKKSDWEAMASAGFRFILFGLESANIQTLRRINKGQADGDIERSCKEATDAGLHPHATCMVGYPWESKADAERTIALTRGLFKRGHIQTLQATIVIPYPGTQLFKDCEEKGWLKTYDWDKYDMRRPVMKCPMSDEEVLEMTRGIYKSCITPKTVMKKILSIRGPEDIRFIWKALRFMRGHLVDFSGKGQK